MERLKSVVPSLANFFRFSSKQNEDGSNETAPALPIDEISTMQLPSGAQTERANCTMVPLEERKAMPAVAVAKGHTRQESLRLPSAVLSKALLQTGSSVNEEDMFEEIVFDEGLPNMPNTLTPPKNAED